MAEQPTPGPDRRKPLGRHALVQMVAIGVVSAAIGITIGLLIPWFPATASTQAQKIDTLYYVLIVATVPIFVLVEVVVLFSVWKFRMRPGEELLDGPPIHGNTRLEIIWTALPAMLIAGLCTYAFVVLQQIEKKPAGPELTVDVTGQQFEWAFQYPLPGGHTVNSDQLYLPDNQPAYFRLHSKDVIHAFWVPAFRVQEDAVPGTSTHVRVTPRELGTYDVVCNELCGFGHAAMRTQVHVVTPAAFQIWLRQQGAPVLPPGAGPTQVAAAGRQVFVGSSGCGACHQLASAGTAGAAGPNLDRALRGKSATFIRSAILRPGSVTARGYASNVMPRVYGSTLSRSQIDALVAYLHRAAAG